MVEKRLRRHIDKSVKNKNVIHRRNQAQYEALVDIFKRYFKFDKRLIKAFVALVVSVINARDVNLRELSLASAARIGIERKSLYRRFQRFFLAALLTPPRVGALVLGLLKLSRVVVSVDRTNWRIGRSDVNILVAGVLFHGVSVPVAWLLLPARTKRGNSRTNHRKRLLRDLLALVPAASVEALVADREFIGAAWISYLNAKGIPFVIRIRSNIAVDGLRASEAIRRRLLSPKRRRNRRFTVCGTEVFVTVKALSRGRKLILVSNRCADERRTLDYYGARESVESLFGHWKSRGFRFESTRMKDRKKLGQWVAVLTVCLTISIMWGVRRNGKRAIGVKKHGFKATSLFLHGLDDVREMLKHCEEKADELKRFLRFILNELEEAVSLT